MAYLLEASSLVHRYGRLEAVRGIDLRLVEGECLGLLGPNGAGKTTTLELLEGILTPAGGRILYRGEALGERFRRESGIMFQSTALPDYLKVREVLELFGRLYAHARPIAELSRELGLDDLLERDSRKLSGGQRQRMLLAVALIHAPSLLFLDEPTAGLDPNARRGFWELIRQIRRQGTAILLTTHYMDEAYALCDRIAIMDRGKIVAQGTPRALLDQHFTDVILQLPKEMLPSDFTSEEVRVIDCGDVVEIVTGDVNAAIAALMSRGVGLGRLQIRARTLDDLFLDLVGKEAAGNEATS